MLISYISKKYHYFLLILGIIFLTTSCTNLTTIHDYFVKTNIQLSEMQKLRLNNYLQGEFYSFELKRSTFAYPLVFLISDDGQRSLILACNSTSNDCNLTIQTFQMIQKYKRTQNINFKILALEKKIINNQKKNFSYIKNQRFKKIDNIKNYHSIFFDKILNPQDSCSSEDC